MAKHSKDVDIEMHGNEFCACEENTHFPGIRWILVRFDRFIINTEMFFSARFHYLHSLSVWANQNRCNRASPHGSFKIHLDDHENWRPLISITIGIGSLVHVNGVDKQREAMNENKSAKKREQNRDD